MTINRKVDFFKNVVIAAQLNTTPQPKGTAIDTHINTDTSHTKNTVCVV